MARFAIRATRGKAAILRATGVPPGAAFVEVGDEVRVRMGWAFHADFTRSAVVTAVRAADVRFTAGAHGWRGRWLVNGASGPIVTLTLREPHRAWVAGFPVKLRELSVSVESPDDFIAALTTGLPT